MYIIRSFFTRFLACVIAWGCVISSHNYTPEICRNINSDDCFYAHVWFINNSYYLCTPLLKRRCPATGKYLTTQEENNKPDADNVSGGTNGDTSQELTYDQKVFISTVYAEATTSASGYPVSPVARQAVACVIMNRIGQREWARFQTAGDVCAYSGFSAHGSYNYQECMKYLDNRDGSNQQIEELISQVLPIYTGEISDITGGAQLFYTPAAMKPHTQLGWNFGLLEEVIISGVDPYFEGRFYRYKGSTG